MSFLTFGLGVGGTTVIEGSDIQVVNSIEVDLTEEILSAEIIEDTLEALIEDISVSGGIDSIDLNLTITEEVLD